MGRKRSVASILEDSDDNNNTRRTSHRNRSVSDLLNEGSSSNRQLNRLVMCYYSRCNGTLIDSQTKTIHDSIEPTTNLPRIRSEISEMSIESQQSQPSQRSSQIQEEISEASSTKQSMLSQDVN